MVIAQAQSGFCDTVFEIEMNIVAIENKH